MLSTSIPWYILGRRGKYPEPVLSTGPLGPALANLAVGQRLRLKFSLGLNKQVQNCAFSLQEALTERLCWRPESLPHSQQTQDGLHRQNRIVVDLRVLSGAFLPSNHGS